MKRLIDLNLSLTPQFSLAMLVGIGIGLQLIPSFATTPRLPHRHALVMVDFSQSAEYRNEPMILERWGIAGVTPSTYLSVSFDSEYLTLDKGFARVALEIDSHSKSARLVTESLWSKALENSEALKIKGLECTHRNLLSGPKEIYCGISESIPFQTEFDPLFTENEEPLRHRLRSLVGFLFQKITPQQDDLMLEAHGVSLTLDPSPKTFIPHEIRRGKVWSIPPERLGIPDLGNGEPIRFIAHYEPLNSTGSIELGPTLSWKVPVSQRSKAAREIARFLRSRAVNLNELKEDAQTD